MTYSFTNNKRCSVLAYAWARNLLRNMTYESDFLIKKSKESAAKEKVRLLRICILSSKTGSSNLIFMAGYDTNHLINAWHFISSQKKLKWNTWSLINIIPIYFGSPSLWAPKGEIAFQPCSPFFQRGRGTGLPAFAFSMPDLIHYLGISSGLFGSTFEEFMKCLVCSMTLCGVWYSLTFGWAFLSGNTVS